MRREGIAPPRDPSPEVAEREHADAVRTAVRAVAVGVAYYVAAQLSLELALIERNVTPLWPPTGIALVAFLVFGWRVWPGVAAAAFLVNAPITTTPLAAAATAAGNTIAPLVACALLNRVGFRQELDRLRDAVAIVVLAALLSMAISASIGAATLALSGSIDTEDLPSAWAVWWTGDAMGVLVVAPFLLSLRHLRRSVRRTPRGWLEVVAPAAVLAGLTFIVVRGDLPLLFLELPLLGLAAWRFQLRAAAPAALVTAGIATWAAAQGDGPFANLDLLEKMVTLQAFNACVALTSFFFAALVSERLRDREALEEAAAELEGRVRHRTAELSASNARLLREVADRTGAERLLRQQERQLAEAQQIARIGSWEWLLPDGKVTWSDEMYRIHGFQPQEFPVTFERAIAQVLPEDVAVIQKNVEDALSRGRSQDLPQIEYRIVRTDGSERTLIGRAALTVGPEGEPLRMLGTVRDVTDEQRAEREHRIAETLQRALLPDRLREIPGIELAARYVPSTRDEVGGDWYDVIPLPNGQVGLAIGDVAGHGLRAASTMGQLRMAVRAYALTEQSPARVMKRVHVLMQAHLPGEMATLVYLVFDPEYASIRFANAGHPPPLLLPNGQTPAYLEEALAPPVGAVSNPDVYVEAQQAFPAGSTLVLFTDGLVERRSASLLDGLKRLRQEASAERDIDTLCDHLLDSFLGSDVEDDVALLILRSVSMAGRPLRLRVPAEPQSLRGLRHAVRRWLREIGAGEDELQAILVACGEASANVIQHAYRAGEGVLELELGMRGTDLEVIVRDTGAWRRSSPNGGGRGLHLMRGLMDVVEVQRAEEGTVVRMIRRRT